MRVKDGDKIEFRDGQFYFEIPDCLGLIARLTPSQAVRLAAQLQRWAWRTAERKRTAKVRR